MFDGDLIVALTDVDRRLLERLLARDSAAWREFVDRFAGLFVNIVQHSAQSRSFDLTADDLEDLCSDILLSIVDHDFAILRRFRGKAALATYLAVVGRRIVVREITRRRADELAKRDFAKTRASETAEPSQPAEARVEELVQTLPENEAKLVRQRLEGKSYREIGEKNGVPVNSVGPSLSRAREKLRQQTEDH